MKKHLLLVIAIVIMPSLGRAQDSNRPVMNSALVAQPEALQGSVAEPRESSFTDAGQNRIVETADGALVFKTIKYPKPDSPVQSAVAEDTESKEVTVIRWRPDEPCANSPQYSDSPPSAYAALAEQECIERRARERQYAASARAKARAARQAEWMAQQAALSESIERTARIQKTERRNRQPALVGIEGGAIDETGMFYPAIEGGLVLDPQTGQVHVPGAAH
jgi:hypothetical protein